MLTHSFSYRSLTLPEVCSLAGKISAVINGDLVGSGSNVRNGDLVGNGCGLRQRLHFSVETISGGRSLLSRDRPDPILVSRNVSLVT